MSHALIDGDLLVYSIGFAHENEHENLAISKLDETLHQIAQGAGCETFEVFLSGDTNFRKEVAVTLPYKGNRKAGRPKHYDVLRKFMLEQYGAVLSEGEEADDLLGCSQKETTIICSIDKDLDMIPGWHFNFKNQERYFIEELEGYRNFCKQMLVGDAVDNIKGIDKIGKVKAAKLLDDASSYQEMLCVVGLWYAIKEENPEERLNENGKLLWIRRKPNQNWSLNDCN